MHMRAVFIRTVCAAGFHDGNMTALSIVVM